MEVLFTLLAERYERGSVMLTSNLPFSKLGADLQRRHDDSSGHRPASPPQRDPGAERAQLSARNREEATYATAQGEGVSGRDQKGILIVAKGEM